VANEAAFDIDITNAHHTALGRRSTFEAPAPTQTGDNVLTEVTLEARDHPAALAARLNLPDSTVRVRVPQDNDADCGSAPVFPAALPCRLRARNRVIVLE